MKDIKKIYIVQYHDGDSHWIGDNAYLSKEDCETALLKDGFIVDEKGYMDDSYEKIDKDFWDTYAYIDELNLIEEQ